MARYAAALLFVALFVCQSGCYLPSLPRRGGSSDGGWTPPHGGPAPAAAADAPEPELVETPREHERKALQQRVRQLLDDGNYDELERTAAALLEDSGPLPNGWSKLDLFYVAFKDQPGDTPDSVRISRIESAKAWIASKPRSTVAHLVLAELWIGYAWLARGSGYANTVSEDGWRLFHERMANAHAALDAARACPERSPRWWITAARIDLGEHWNPSVSQATFDEAIATYPRYYSYYFVRAWHLQPRWYGRDGECEAFAAASADRIGGDEGDALYARMAWDLDNIAYNNVFRESRIEWPRAHRGFEVLLKQYPDDLTVLSTYCKLSALAGDAATARPLLDRIANRVDTSVWGKEEFKSCRSWVLAH